MPEPELSSPYFQNDRHVSSSQEDEFDRYPFAAKLATMIESHRSPHGLVIGLYGQWGEGKSSLLDFIVTALETSATANIIVVKFNPWRFAGEDQLLMSFFAELRSTLGAKIDNKTIASALDSYAQEIIARRIAADDTDLIELDKFKSNSSLEALKDNISLLIKESGKHVLILIDDIDRLNKEEIEATLRLVKLTGDFNYTTYLLALDHHMVADAIGKRYPGKSRKAGMKFLEKIIQVPLYLPSIQEERMRSFFQKRLDEVLTSTKHLNRLLETETNRYTSALAASIIPKITNPRHIHRLFNTLLVVIPLLEEEANIADIILIESLRVFYPKWYTFIKNNQSKVTGTLEREFSHFAHKELDDTCGAKGENFGKAKAIIFTLFPKLASLYGNDRVRARSRTEADLAQAQSIASDYYFKRYFSYAVQPGEVPEKVFNDFLESMADGNIESARLQALEIIKLSNDSELLRRLENLLPKINQSAVIEDIFNDVKGPRHSSFIWTTTDATSFCMLLVSLSSDLSFNNISSRALRALSRSSGLLLSYLKFIAEERCYQVVSLIEYIIKESSVIALPIEFFSDLTRITHWSDESDLGELKKCITPEVYKKVASKLIDRLKQEADETGTPWFSVYPMQTKLLIQAWNNAYGLEDMIFSLREIFEKDKERLLDFLEYISPLGSLNGELMFSNIDKDTYKFIKKEIDEGYLYKLALKVTQGEERIPYNEDVFHRPTRPERAHQLVYLHQNDDESHIHDISHTEVDK